MIFHLAFARDWSAAQVSGQYTVSTRGRTFAAEGFIHCSTATQWPLVRQRFYADVAAEDLVLLEVDESELDVRYESAPGGTELFPHLYQPLPVAAVRAARDLLG